MPIPQTPQRERSFWPAFQKRWAALLCEQTQGLGAWSEAMRRALGQGIIEVPNSADAHAALDSLNARLSRLESLCQFADDEPPVDDATRMHFLCYGAALLSAPGSCAGFALSEREDELLSYENLRLLIDELCHWLQLLKLAPRRVFLLEDFDSQILGRAIALRLGVGFEIVDDDGYARSRSLIVSADSRRLTASALRAVFPGQVLYALNLNRKVGSIAPDVASLIQPAAALPWQEQHLSSRKIAGVVERISNAPLRANSNDWLARLEFYRARRAQLVAGNSMFHRSAMIPEIG